MAGIYEALQRADEERHPDGPGARAGELREPADDLEALSAMLRRLEDRVETEISDDHGEGFEYFASLEVSIGALEDRIDDERRAQFTASSDLAERLDRLVAEVAELGSRIDHELPLLRSELIRAIERRRESPRAPGKQAPRGGSARRVLGSLYRRFLVGRRPAPARSLPPR
jgi:hypothetical protein